ncbi:hypothetical protein C8R47DRAFT_1112041 [Mycena vitilis]|nr:hypothetical protein C8R47DRAFT_1112041 [Mycena vitilis]
MLAARLAFAVILSAHCHGALVDLTSTNRRPAIPGLPDWSQAGYEKGLKPLPDDSLVAKIITADQLASLYGVEASDGMDDTDGLQKAISDNPGSDGAFTLVQLPPGTIDLSHPIYLSSNYLILRGAGNDPDQGTVLSFDPDVNTQYDVLTSPGGDNWDLDGMEFSWSYQEPANTKSGVKTVTGNATSGWLWPGRSIFHVGSRAIASKFATPASLAPANRIDFFYGSVNYHWRNDTAIKGYMADQRLEIAGFAGTRKVYIDTQNSSWGAASGTDIWIGAPVRSYDYDSWQVQDKNYYQNEYMFQDWFTATGSGDDDMGHYIELDHDLEFDVYTNSVTGGSPQLQGETVYTKVMPIDDPVHHVGIEDLYMTQPMPSLSAADAVDNYGNMAPAQAMHGVVFRYARDSWIRNIRTYMTGSHPIATEAARYIQIQDNYFDGSWNKGAGGNGYLRGSRVWDSLYFNNTLRNLRHFTFQWCAMRNVATMQNMTNDMNMHGGYEGRNLLELNYVSVPYSHRSGSCKAHCGGEGGSQDLDNGTWAPIYWSTGSKASKWSGATGPQNVFYRNYMLKAFAAGSDQVEYQPYFARDGSLSTHVWQFGWDRNSPSGSRYQHLSNDGSNLLVDWQGHEQDTFMDDPNVGVNGDVTSEYTSLFFRDVSNGTGITTFSSIAGYADCLGKVSPTVVGYYLGSAATRECLPWNTDAIDTTTFTHVLASSGVLSLTASQQAQVKDIVSLKSSAPDFKVLIAVGGWGLGVDASPLLAIATSSSARTKFGTSALALLTSLGADGIDIEWTPCIGATCVSATQFSTIASAVKTGIGSNLLSLSTPSSFWSLPGVNTITNNLKNIVEFISLITHQTSPFTDQDVNEVDVIQTTVKQAQSAGMPPTMLLFGIPFYSRPLGNSTLQSTCLAQTDLAQGTYPYYAVDSILNDYPYDSDECSDLSTDQTTLVYWLTMSDGSLMTSDNPWSVSARALLSQNLCMGGVSVFSLDQDNENNDLTNGIYAPGGLLPTTGQITTLLSTESLDSTGFLKDGVYDDLSAQLSAQYPFLNAQDTYRILLLGALQIQTQLSNRLRLFLTESELSADKFSLYKTWEGKAADYQLANATGINKQFWHCEGDGRSLSSCPGTINEDAGIGGSPHLTGFDTVQWFLDDADAFKQYLNNSMGVNLDDLVDGSFYVTRLDESCSPPSVPPDGPDPDTNGTLGGLPSAPIPSRRHLHDSTTFRSRHRHHSHLVPPVLIKKVIESDASDPYDPPENCRTLWTGLRLIDSDTFFPDPAVIIQNFVTSTDTSVTQFTRLAGALDADPGNIITLLHTTLTSISLANQTIADTQAYIQEVKHDQALQAAFDQAHARESVGKVIGNIALLLLGFVPGVGEITDIVSGGVDTFSAISKLMDVATLAKTLDKDSDLFKLIGSGLRTEEDIAEAASATEDALGADALATRGKLGSSVTKAQDTALQCASSSLKAWVMDTTKLSSAIKSSIHTSKRTLPVAAVIPNNIDIYVPKNYSFELRAKAPTTVCVFQVENAKELKKTSATYRKSCKANNLPMQVPDILPDPTTTSTMSFLDCVKIYQGRCQCDHLVEPEEFTVLAEKMLTTDEAAELCNAFTTNTKEAIKEIINDPKNMAGLFGANVAGGRFNPNSMKNSLMKNYNTEAALKGAFEKYSLEGRNLMYDIAGDHLVQYSSERSIVAADLDNAIHSMYNEVATKGTPAQLKLMSRLYTPDNGGVRPIFTNLVKAHEEHAAATLDALKSNLEPADDDPDDPPADDNKTDDQNRSSAKRARADSSACGTSASKKSKVG